MTLAAIGNGLLYPAPPWMVTTSPGNFDTIDAATEKFAMLGRIYIDGRPAGTKTLSTGTIQWRTGTVTFANGGTTVDVGLQGVASGSGPIAQPDGTFTVKTTLTGGGGGITANAWQTTTMNSGTVSLSHGDLVAVVWDMTARAGADSVIITTARPSILFLAGNMSMPVCNSFVSSAWQTAAGIGAGQSPNCVIVFDDGTLGWFDQTMPLSFAQVDSYQDSTNPDERGLIFQVPWACKIDGFWSIGGATDANSDFTFKLYSDPLGTPSLLASQTVLAENLGVAANSSFIAVPLNAEISLSANTNYIVTMLATGTSNTRLNSQVLANTAHRAAYVGGTTLAKGTRNNSAGAFSAESPAITMYNIGVRLSQLDDGTGAGSGGFPVLGGPFT